ncbi:MAG: LytTR family transcriptional regulator [Firmicutes bacterium]|nr:LytTR family DNA-binding domain-containing protein [Bacillota bacterium]NSW92120.1 LytTR family transcriptional regulator [Bacillota bacterium]
MSSLITDKKQKVSLVCGGEQILLDQDEIVMCCIRGKQIKIYMKDGKVYTCYGNLKKIGQKLTEGSFFRSHKSYLVNVSFIEKITSQYGEREIEFNCIRERAALSRRKAKELKKLLE